MSMMAWPHSLDLRTRLDIERHNACGCQQSHDTTGRWSICDYHEGYDAALEEHSPE